MHFISKITLLDYELRYNKKRKHLDGKERVSGQNPKGCYTQNCMLTHKHKGKFRHYGQEVNWCEEVNQIQLFVSLSTTSSFYNILSCKKPWQADSHKGNTRELNHQSTTATHFHSQNLRTYMTDLLKLFAANTASRKLGLVSFIKCSQQPKLNQIC